MSSRPQLRRGDQGDRRHASIAMDGATPLLGPNTPTNTGVGALPASASTVGDTKKGQEGGLFYRRIVAPIKRVVTAGITPSQLAVAVAVGTGAGLFPFPGLTTPMTLVFIYVTGCNPVVAMVVNLLLTPVNIAVVIPFMWIGCYFTGVEPTPISVTILKAGLASDPGGTLAAYGAQILLGMFAWAVLLPVIAAVVYFATLPLASVLVRGVGKSTG